SFSTSLPWMRRLSSSKLLVPWRSLPVRVPPPSRLPPPVALFSPVKPRCKRDMVSPLRKGEGGRMKDEAQRLAHPSFTLILLPSVLVHPSSFLLHPLIQRRENSQPRPLSLGPACASLPHSRFTRPAMLCCTLLLGACCTSGAPWLRDSCTARG